MEVIKFEVQDVATAIGVLATSLKRELRVYRDILEHSNNSFVFKFVFFCLYY